MKKDRIIAAALLYNRRKRSIYAVPYDCCFNGSSGRWRIRVNEPDLECCEGIRSNTVRLRHHCSATHVANMFDVDQVELLRTAKVLRALSVLERL